MQLGSIRTPSGTTAVRVEGDELVHLPWTMRELLTDHVDHAGADSIDGAALERSSAAAADWAPLVPDPSKIVCVGLNYHEHVREVGKEAPRFPAYFAKYADALIGPHDDIMLPAPEISTNVDWEVELCVVIGRAARHVPAERALEHVAGYTVLNDVSIRDWQNRTNLYLAGKTFEATTPVGPVLTTVDELGDGRGLAVRTEVDGVVKQDSTTDELVFGVPELIADLSTVTTLRPGDLISTGTPSGVGVARRPQEWLAPGTEVVTSIEGIGELRNRCVLPA